MVCLGGMVVYLLRGEILELGEGKEGDAFINLLGVCYLLGKGYF